MVEGKRMIESIVGWEYSGHDKITRMLDGEAILLILSAT